MSSTIHSQIKKSFVCSIVCVLSFSIAFSLFSSYVQTKEIFEKTQEQESAQIATQLLKSTNFIENDLLVLSQTPPVKEIITLSHIQKRGPLSKENSKSLQVSKARLQQIFSGFIENNATYLQVRLIMGNIQGKELLRVNQLDGKPHGVDEKSLQEKGDRQYVKGALALKEREVYVSTIDSDSE